MIVHRSHVVKTRAGQCDRCLASIRERAILVQCPYGSMNTGTLAGMVKQKRGYSREFTPQTDRRIKLEIDRVPPSIADSLRAKCRREGISIRALTLRLWKTWIEG